MAAVAQINVNFASRVEFSSNIPSQGVSTTRVISPYTLVQYALYNRENPNLQPPNPSDRIHLNYPGGFITAGEKIDYKHSDFNVRGNLYLQENVFIDRIYSRNKGKSNLTSSDFYQNTRPNTDRSVSIYPRLGDENKHYIDIRSADPADKNILLFCTNTTLKDTSIILKNNTNQNFIDVTARDITFKSPDSNVTMSAVLSGTLAVTDNTTFQRNVQIIGNDSASTEYFTIRKNAVDDYTFRVDTATGATDSRGTLNIGPDKFKVVASTGNTDIQGYLKIVTNKFTVDTSGNTVIDGNLTVNNTNSNTTTIKGETTMQKKLTFNNAGNGDVNSANRRITGVRRLVDINEFIGTTYDDDVLTIFDFKRFGFKKGMIMMWSPISPDNYALNFTQSGPNAGNGIGNMTGWAVCNGNNGTVDLENRFIVGGRVSDGQTTITGSATTTGGTKDAIVVSHAHTASSTNDGVHTHTATDAGHTHSYTRYGSTPPQSGKSTPCWYGGQSDTTGIGYASITVSDAGSHNHTITVNNFGSSGTNQNLPPYYSLIYIMKIT